MPDLAIVLLVAGAVCERAWSEWLHAKERRYLVNATIATTPGELKALEHKGERRPKAVVPAPDGYEHPVGI